MGGFANQGYRNWTIAVTIIF